LIKNSTSGKRKAIKVLLTGRLRLVIVGIGLIVFELVCVGAIDLAFKLSAFWR